MKASSRQRDASCFNTRSNSKALLQPVDRDGRLRQSVYVDSWISLRFQDPAAGTHICTLFSSNLMAGGKLATRQSSAIAILRIPNDSKLCGVRENICTNLLLSTDPVGTSSEMEIKQAASLKRVKAVDHGTRKDGCPTLANPLLQQPRAESTARSLLMNFAGQVSCKPPSSLSLSFAFAFKQTPLLCALAFAFALSLAMQFRPEHQLASESTNKMF